MDGFWRQLYDPFYTGSYKIAYTTKTKYDEKPESYYYYVRCEQNVAYVAGRQYYTQTLAGEYIALSSLSEAVYKKSPKDYYYIHQCKKGENYILKNNIIKNMMMSMIRQHIGIMELRNLQKH